MVCAFSLNFPWKEPTHFIQRILYKEGFVGPKDEWCNVPIRKIHTFRVGDRWKVNAIIEMDIHVRSSNQERFNTEVCTGTQELIIRRSYGAVTPHIWIDGTLIPVEMHAQIAMNDGFPSVKKFYRYFSKGFEGQIVHWTDFKY